MTGEVLIVTEMACAVPKKHPLARKRSLGPADLEGHLLISLGAGTRIGKLIEGECRKAGKEPPEIGIEASSSLAACLMVSEGAGIGLVDRATSLSRKFEDLAFRPFVPRISVAVQLIYPRDRPRSRATLDLSAQLRRTVQEGPH